MSKKSDYQNSKIYKIESHQGNKVYIGSTTEKTLARRMACHRSHYKGWKDGKRYRVSSYYLFDEYGLENCNIVLVENYPCNTKDELTIREQFYIKNTENCVNKCRAVTSIDEKRQQLKEYHEKNIDAIHARKNEKYTCDCGAILSKSSKSRHIRTPNHIKYLESLSLTNQ